MSDAREEATLADRRLSGAPSPPLSLRVNFSWMFFGRAAFAVCKWAILAALTKLCTPSLVGQYALGLAITNPVILFANLQLRAVQATDAQDEFEFRQYVGLRLVSTAIALAVVVGILLVAGYHRDKALIILMVGVTKAIESVSDVIYGLFQKMERMDRIAGSLIIRGVGSAVAVTVVVYLTRDVFWGLTAMALVWLAALAFHDAAHALRLLGGGEEDSRRGRLLGALCRLRPDTSARVMWRLMVLALPLGIVALLLTLNQSIPRFFIEGHLGEADLGIFAALAYLLVPGGMVANSIGQAAVPRLARYFLTGRTRAFDWLLLRLVAIAVAFGLAGVLVAWLFGEWLLGVIYTSEYAERNDVFIWVMVAATFFYVGTVLGFAITATRRFTRFIVPYLAWTAVAAVVSWLLIPRYGLLGAAWATVAIAVAGCLTPLGILATVRRPS